MTTGTPDPILDGLWRVEAIHPEWTEDEGGEEGWEPSVAWWAVATPAGLVLIDPLVADWDPVDGLVAAHDGCAGILRTCHWHQRSVAETAERYGAPVWAKPAPGGTPGRPFDRALADGDTAIGGIVAYDLERDDEVAFWCPEQAALLFGDAMLRRESGELRRCPDSWTQPDGGAERLRTVLTALAERLPARHVLVSHGPLVLGDAAAALAAALA